MQKVFLTIIIGAIVLVSVSCQKQNTTTTPSELTNLKDSASYATGIIIAKKYLDDNNDSILNRELTLKGINDVLKNDTSLLSFKEAEEAINVYMRQIIDEKYEYVKKASNDFLSENLANTGVIQTISGLQYKVIKEGNGSEHPSITDNVIIKFEGRKIDGTIIGGTGDNALENNLMALPKGLAEGITQMTPGAKYQFYIPYELAFGENGYKSVEPYSTVIFDVELLEIVKK